MKEALRREGESEELDAFGFRDYLENSDLKFWSTWKPLDLLEHISGISHNSIQLQCIHKWTYVQIYSSDGSG